MSSPLWQPPEPGNRFRFRFTLVNTLVVNTPVNTLVHTPGNTRENTLVNALVDTPCEHLCEYSCEYSCCEYSCEWCQLSSQPGAPRRKRKLILAIAPRRKLILGSSYDFPRRAHFLCKFTKRKHFSPCSVVAPRRKPLAKSASAPHPACPTWPSQVGINASLHKFTKQKAFLFIPRTPPKHRATCF